MHAPRACLRKGALRPHWYYYYKPCFHLQSVFNEVGSICLVSGGTGCVIIIIDNFCIALFSGVHKLTALNNSQHYNSESVFERVLKWD